MDDVSLWSYISMSILILTLTFEKFIFFVEAIEPWNEISATIFAILPVCEIYRYETGILDF